MRGPFGGVVEFFMKDAAGQIGAGILLACALTIGYRFLTKDETSINRSNVEETSRPVVVDSLEIAKARVRARLVPSAPAEFISSRRTRQSPATYCGKVITEDVEGHGAVIRWIVRADDPTTEWRVGRDSMDLLWIINCS